MKLSVLIADDEPLARDRLRDLLEAMADVVVVGEAADGVEAIELIRRERPTVALLDIQMPGLDGLSVAEATAAPEGPAVIFVTAYHRYAVRAFEVSAIDYVLKPFDAERLARALSRARDRRHRGDVPSRAQLSALMTAVQGGAAGAKLAVRDGARTIYLEVARVGWIEAAGNYACVHAEGTSFLMRSPLSELEARLRPMGFLRVHRSAIVNTEHVREIVALSGRRAELVLEDGTRVPMRRQHEADLRRALGDDGEGV